MFLLMCKWHINIMSTLTIHIFFLLLCHFVKELFVPVATWKVLAVGGPWQAQCSPPHQVLQDADIVAA